MSDNWPHEGAIKYDNYSTRYREGLDLVVKDINLDVKSGEKVSKVLCEDFLLMKIFRLELLEEQEQESLR